ncbi:PHB depolymerase family esterase [Actimicrobium sp. CCC2.4]|uniref:extracellular catalytic domain type 1 short-chain-length polyhydroxyalkanoate depolymerase n=1 Tax=Actimicrobium sp. CCC2.4 TaxID=3048606 RepID=UPI002AC8EC51|nr:PHB depolymerase family esterase [Actimicrobium sp. CCC2.4]WPX33434.1 PHB depolymerase family esterase [Actimicrobium sp. CCC2.4]
MVNMFRSLWLGSARKLGSLQRKQTRKIVRNLFEAVTPAVPKAKKSRRQSAGKAAGKPSVVRPPGGGVWGRSTFIAGIDDVASGIVAGKRMEYWLYRPAGMRADATLPLVVMLHGCEQGAVDFAQGTRMNALAESKGFGVLYPQQSARAQRNRCWPWFRNEVQAGDGEILLIAAIIRRVVARQGFDPQRVYVAGLSAGAAMAHILALRHPELIAAVGLHSAPVFGAASTTLGAYGVMQRGGLTRVGAAIQAVTDTSAAPFPTMPAILIQGQQDSVVRPINFHQLEQQFCELNGLTAAERQEPTYRAAGRSARAAHGFSTLDYRAGKKILLRLCEIQQLKHAWSGGDPALPFNERKGPDASRMMWTFFAPHRRLLPEA